MKIFVVTSRDGLEIVEGGVEMADEATVEDLKQAIHKKSAQRWPPLRQRLTLPLLPGQEKPTALESTKKLKEYLDHTNTATSCSKQLHVLFKDLGPQILYRELFFWEYIGPLLIYPIFYYAPYLYGSRAAAITTHPSPAQTLAFWFWIFHYAKRILETFFVHRFSHPSAPIKALFLNCLYYWSSAAVLSYAINHPSYQSVGKLQMYFGFGFGVVNELGNLYCHVILKQLRSKDGEKGYQIPRGFLFDFISCPNYTTEIFAWLGFNIATQTALGYTFMLLGARTMGKWALAKHKRLEKMYDGKDGRTKYPKRWVMIPPFY